MSFSSEESALILSAPFNIGFVKFSWLIRSWSESKNPSLNFLKPTHSPVVDNKKPEMYLYIRALLATHILL